MCEGGVTQSPYSVKFQECEGVWGLVPQSRVGADEARPGVTKNTFGIRPCGLVLNMV